MFCLLASILLTEEKCGLSVEETGTPKPALKVTLESSGMLK